MRKRTGEKAILEFIFDCKRRDELLLDFLALEKWTPAMGALIICGVRPMSESDQEIPSAAIGLDDEPLDNTSRRLKNARRLLENWRDEFEDDETPSESIDPYEFINWAIDSGYVTDWIRLIGTFHGLDGSTSDREITPGVAVNVGGISDTERITILPRSLMSALVETARSPAVQDRALSQAVMPPLSLPAQNQVGDNGGQATKIQFSKKNLITRVIELAREQASDPNDSELIWLALIRLARSKEPPKPLIEYLSDERAIKWHDESKSKDDDVQIMTKALFKRRLNRIFRASIKEE